MANQEMREKIMHYQASILNEADDLTQRDLQAILDRLNSDQPVELAFLNQLDLRIDAVFDTLRGIRDDIVTVLQLPYRDQLHDEVEKAINLLDNDHYEAERHLKIILGQMDSDKPTDVDDFVLDELAVILNDTRTHLNRVEQSVIGVIQQAHQSAE